MELGNYQVFISLVLILAGALVALICDFLKGNNERLRELTLELRVRREEDQKRIDMMAPVFAFAGHSQEANPAAARNGQSFDGFEEDEEEEELLMARHVAAKMLEVKATTKHPAAWRPESHGVDSPSAVQTSPAPPSMEPETVEIILEPATSIAKHIGAAANQPPLPTGLQDADVLKQLLESGRCISGLIVSISVQGPTRIDGSLPVEICNVIQTLLAADDLAAERTPGEFILICPTTRGAAAQRRLMHIGRQLRDYQLPADGGPIAFSLGGEDVRNELLKDAIELAEERMLESKRGRKVISMQPREPLRKVM